MLVKKILKNAYANGALGLYIFKPYFKAIKKLLSIKLRTSQFPTGS